MADIGSMYLNVIVLLWVWITLIFYLISYRKFASVELKKTVFWVMAALFFLVLNVTFVFLNRTLYLLDTDTGSMLSLVMTSLSALCFMVSAVYMRRFSQVFGFADRKK
jgi:uncharacterized membrane protein